MNEQQHTDFINSVVPKVCPRLVAALRESLEELNLTPGLEYEVATLALLHVAARMIATPKEMDNDPHASARDMAQTFIKLVEQHLGAERGN